jgi:glutamine synthetase
MKTGKDVLKAIADNDIRYVDFRFTDPRGKWQHVTFDVSIVDEEVFTEGVMFDGSSIAGWKAINESDMTLMPDPATACMDPFYAASTMSIVCDILEPSTGEPYDRDPRGIAKKAETYMKSLGIGDTTYSVPRPSSSSSTTSSSWPTRTTRVSGSTGPSCRPTATRNTKAAIWATGSR